MSGCCVDALDILPRELWSHIIHVGGLRFIDVKSFAQVSAELCDVVKDTLEAAYFEATDPLGEGQFRWLTARTGHTFRAVRAARDHAGLKLTPPICDALAGMRLLVLPRIVQVSDTEALVVATTDWAARVQGLTLKAVESYAMRAAEAVEYTPFSDLGLERLAGMENITVLDLSMSQVTGGGLADHIGSFQNLTALDLSVCDDITEPAMRAVSTLPHLTSLSLSMTNMRNSGLRYIANMAGLKHFDIGMCRGLLDSGLEHVGSLTSLTTLNISYNGRLTAGGVAHLSALGGLTSLNMRQCDMLNDEALSHLLPLLNLTELVTTHCPGVTNAGLETITELTTLTALDISSLGNIDGFGLVGLPKLKNLTHLDLRDCRDVGDEGMAYVGRLLSLVALVISECRLVTDVGLGHLGGLPSLALLNCSYLDRVTDQGVSALSNGPQPSLLQELDLRGCTHLTDTTLHHLTRLGSLVSLDVGFIQGLTDAGLRALAAGSPPKLTQISISTDLQVTRAGADAAVTLAGWTKVFYYNRVGQVAPRSEGLRYPG